MPQRRSKNPADYIVPLDINGLEGRMLHLPPPEGKSREILFIYGHHSSLERWWGVIQVLNRYGGVTVPDLPGFGGMDSFYKIGKKPTIDNLADYLAAFIKLRYKRKKVVIAGLSFGFVIVTRMLQRYPELTKKVTLLVSIVGFAHRDDFIFSKPRYYTYYFGTKILSSRALSTIFRYTALQPFVIRALYAKTPNAKHKFGLAGDEAEFKRMLDVEVGLWHDNDVRTWTYTTAEFLKLDNCARRINLPIWHIAAKNDHYFDNHLVEQHMRTIFKNYKMAEVDLKAHAPSVIATEKEAAALLPERLRRAINRLKS
jgi:pimeloyl-ACP methyl ester carboxylesterase